MLRLCFFIVYLLLAGCRGQDNWFWECIDLEGPELTHSDLPVAVLNQEYNATIKVNITNNPFDDEYDYYFDVSGSLPRGIWTYQNGHDRELVITGTPVDPGVYRIKVSVDVRDPDQGTSGSADLCFDHTSKKYNLVVNEI